MPPTLAALREAEWLSRRRAMAYCRAIAVLTGVMFVGAVVTSHDFVDLFGHPLGTDFVSFWTASQLALTERPAAVYDMATHHAAQMALFGKAASNYTAYFYPPAFLLFCLPLALLPYVAGWAAWIGVTGFALWRCLQKFLPSREMLLPILAYPALVLNAEHGQNGFLTGALFASAALVLPKQAKLAGLLLGCL